MTAHEIIAVLRNVKVIEEHPDYVLLRVDLPYSTEAPPFDTVDEVGFSLKSPEPKDPHAEERAIEGWFHAEFWPAYWRHDCKADALKAAKKHAVTQQIRAAIMKGVKAQAPEMWGREKQHRPHAATWLNREQWTDPVETPAADRRPTYFDPRSITGGVGGR